MRTFLTASVVFGAVSPSSWSSSSGLVVMSSCSFGLAMMRISWWSLSIMSRPSPGQLAMRCSRSS